MLAPGAFIPVVSSQCGKDIQALYSHTWGVNMICTGARCCPILNVSNIKNPFSQQLAHLLNVISLLLPCGSPLNFHSKFNKSRTGTNSPRDFSSSYNESDLDILHHVRGKSGGDSYSRVEPFFFLPLASIFQCSICLRYLPFLYTLVHYDNTIKKNSNA